MGTVGGIVVAIRGILTKTGKLSAKSLRFIDNHPEIIQTITTATSFLAYDANIRTRIWCILLDITEQPRCKTCLTIVKMRLTGRYRNTFPTFCSTKCSASDSAVKHKKAMTNMQRYGCTNVLTRYSSNK